MSIRKNTNPIPLNLPPELQELLIKNGMRAQITGSSNGFKLIVQGHDSPLLTYPINEKQLMALTDWGTNYVNKRSYNTFSSIVAADFDMPKDFVHARNANGRVAMGLHGYRIGTGEYGRTEMSQPFHVFGNRFLGWTPRQQEGFHLRRIGGNLYYPGAPMVPERPDGRMKPGELQSGGYGFYYKGQTTAPVVQRDVLQDLQSVITPIHTQPRNNEPAKPYKELITSPVYFSNEKWQECLSSHGIVIDAQARTLTIQSSAVQADFQYDLTEEEIKALTNNSIKEVSIEKRLNILENIIKEDFSEAITMDMLDSKQPIGIALQSSVREDLSHRQEHENRQVGNKNIGEIHPEQLLSKEAVVMNGNDLKYLNGNKGWYREGRISALSGGVITNLCPFRSNPFSTVSSPTKGKYMLKVCSMENLSGHPSVRNFILILVFPNFIQSLFCGRYTSHHSVYIEIGFFFKFLVPCAFHRSSREPIC